MISEAEGMVVEGLFLWCLLGQLYDGKCGKSDLYLIQVALPTLNWVYLETSVGCAREGYTTHSIFCKRVAQM